MQYKKRGITSKQLCKDKRKQKHSPSSDTSDCLPCNIKGKKEQATTIQKEFSQSCVKQRLAHEENNCDFKISAIKIYWTIVTVYAKEV